MTEAVKTLEVRPEEAGVRLDVFVVTRGLDLTRSQVERLCKSGLALINGRPARPGHRVAAGQQVELTVPSPEAEMLSPEEIPLEVIFEDEEVAVIAKPQGMVVHPGAGRKRGTLVNALLARYPGLGAVGEPGRPGIVHRLDKDTSGLMIAAKTGEAYRGLSRQVRERELERRYLALVWGRVAEDYLTIETPIGRRLRDPTRMAAVPRPPAERRAREACTQIRTLERYSSSTLLEARIATGRTHQIRVHLAHLGYPVIGDHTYGLRRAKQEKAKLGAETLSLVQGLPGQMLHAQALTFRHPKTGQLLTFSTAPPRAMANLISRLKAESARAT